MYIPCLAFKLSLLLANSLRCDHIMHVREPTRRDPVSSALSFMLCPGDCWESGRPRRQDLPMWVSVDV